MKVDTGCIWTSFLWRCMGLQGIEDALDPPGCGHKLTNMQNLLRKVRNSESIFFFKFFYLQQDSGQYKSLVNSRNDLSPRQVSLVKVKADKALCKADLRHPTFLLLLFFQISGRFWLYRARKSTEAALPGYHTLNLDQNVHSHHLYFSKWRRMKETGVGWGWGGGRCHTSQSFDFVKKVFNDIVCPRVPGPSSLHSP